MTLLYYNGGALQVRAYRYHVEAQYIDMLDSRYKEAYEVEDGNIVNVYLKGVRSALQPDAEIPDDLLLYSYYK